jgi:hypothetical protein
MYFEETEIMDKLVFEAMRKNRTCVSKRPYASEIIAETMKKRLGLDLNIYYCPYCNFYHLTKRVLKN